MTTVVCETRRSATASDGQVHQVANIDGKTEPDAPARAGTLKVVHRIRVAGPGRAAEIHRRQIVVTGRLIRHFVLERSKREALDHKD